MDSLRWILLALGALTLGVIFAYSRGWFAALRPKRRSEHKPPPLDAAGGEWASEPKPEVREPRLPALDESSKLVAVRILPRAGSAFPAEEMVLALRAAGLRHGQFGIFHYHHPEDDERIMFSVASLVEPGSFDLSRLKESVYSGVSIFAVFPAHDAGVELFDAMVEKAREISKAVDGALADEAGGALSLQRERYMREDLIDYLRRIEVAAGREEYQ